MVECQICLHCGVDHWFCQSDIRLPKTEGEERLISLSGEVEFSGFIERMPYDFRLVCDFQPQRSDAPLDLNVLEVNEAMEEFGIPRNLSALLSVTQRQFDDLRDCLFQASRTPNAGTEISLMVAGLQKSSGDMERIEPIEGRKMSIVGFGWKFSTSSGR